MIKYFGPDRYRKPDEEHVDVPTDKTCNWCGEGFQAGDMGNINFAGQATHHECQLRSVIGSVGHQLKLCSCFGGKWDEPSIFTRRQCSRLAAEIHYAKLNQPYPS